MTLSVLIPVYNEDAQELVETVLQQISVLHLSAEVIIGDDHSTEPMSWLQTVAAWPNVRVCRNVRNLGRAANRNSLVRMAQGEWLLFLDSGNSITNPDFLGKYYEARNQADIIVGGVCVSPAMRNEACLLRWEYEAAAAATYQKTLSSPIAIARWPFRSAAFLSSREVFNHVAFDDELKGYGYEDVLFGIEAQRQGFRIAHINAPVQLGQLEDNAVFLAKTEDAMQTLHRLRHRLTEPDAKNSCNIRLLSSVARIRQMHLTPFVRLGFRLTRGRLRRNLLSSHPSLRAFALYKLGFYMMIE